MKTNNEILKILEVLNKDEKSLNLFLHEILTPKEYEEIGKRWQILKYLYEGMPQIEISKKLGVGIATVTRGSRVLQSRSITKKILDGDI